MHPHADCTPARGRGACRCPVISAEAQTRILRYIDTGHEESATLACGGSRPAGPQFERGFWVEPTIFTDVRNDMTIAREEIFGPVLAVIRAESTEAAIRIANDTEYGLSAGVHGQRRLPVRRLQTERSWP
jgi:aldehyde dehydrogenase (NAD+)